VLSSRYVYVYGNYNANQNAVTNASTIDPNGKRSFTPVNVNGNNNWHIGSHWERGPGDKKINHGISSSISGGRNIIIINNDQGANRFLNYDINYNMNYGVTDKYRFSAGPQLGMFLPNHLFARASIITSILTAVEWTPF
jgi:hypothetical protein